VKIQEWQKFIVESQRCERCESSSLEDTKIGVELYWKCGGNYQNLLIWKLPVIQCSDCSQVHVCNSVLGILRNQFLYGESEVMFDDLELKKYLSGLQPEERWVEENYYFSISAINCGFQVRSLSDENELENFEINKEIYHGETAI